MARFDVLVSPRRDAAAARAFFSRALSHAVAPVEVTTERVTTCDCLQRPAAFESAHRAQPRFESSVIGFDGVVTRIAR
jgi:transposase-like protein